MAGICAGATCLRRTACTINTTKPSAHDALAQRKRSTPALGENMKASFSVACATGVVVLVSAYGGTRISPAIHPESLARIEAITSYCEKADPSSESQYASRLTAVI